MIPDSMVVSAGGVGKCLGAIRARVGLLAGVDVLMCLEVELGREALTTLGADNRANLQVNGPNVPLHQTRARLKTTLFPVCIVPNTLGFSTVSPLDVLIGVDDSGGASSGRRLRRLILGGKGWGRGRGRCLGRTPSRVRVARSITAMLGASG